MLVNDQSTMVCNHRCVYCGGENNPCQYDNRIVLKTIDGFVSKKKPSYFNAFINSGETSLRKDLDELLDYFCEQQLENIRIFSNASVYSNGIEKSLKQNNITLITSIDAGTQETYKKVHGVDQYNQVIDNLISYSVLGNGNNIRIKYVILDDGLNTGDDDLLGFLYAALLIKPEQIQYSIDFRDGQRIIPESTIDFAAKMFFLSPIITNKSPSIFNGMGLSGYAEEFQYNVRDRVASFDDRTKASLTQLAVNFLQCKSK